MPSQLKTRRNYGWVPDLPDARDHGLTVALPVGVATVDLRDRHRFKVMDQGMIGSCVAHATSSAIEYAHAMRPRPDREGVFPISRLFLYYEARRALGTINEDSGCCIRDAMRVAYNLGVPRESGWLYRQEEYAVPPPKRSYLSALFHKITSYKKVGVSVTAVKAALAAGLPVVIGLSLYDSFFSQADGTVPMPDLAEPMIGGHAMLLVGYDDAVKRFIFLNCWGEEWGTGGFGTLPYAYVGNPDLGDDYWTCTDELYKERMP